MRDGLYNTIQITNSKRLIPRKNYAFALAPFALATTSSCMLRGAAV